MHRPKHKAVKASPEEAAYDLPNELDFRKLTPIGFGLKALDAFEAGSRRIVELDPDVAKVFKNSQSVNDVLRAIIAHMPAKRRKTA